MLILARSCCILAFALALFVPGAHAASPRVGDGSGASCTAAALKTAIDAGGAVTFNCGTAPFTITLTDTIEVRNTVSIDGGGLLTLNGGGKRLFLHRSFDRTASLLTLKNMTITNGRASGVGEDANGGAIRSVNNSFNGADFPQVLTIENVSFLDNDSSVTSFSGNAYDFGGGAIYSLGGKVIVKNSIFRDNDANNGAGGAIHLLQSSVSIESSTFGNNSAIGKTPADSQGGAIYVDGLSVTDKAARLSISGSRFDGNRSYNSGGAIYVNVYNDTNEITIDQSSFTNNALIAGNGALGGAISGGGTDSNPRITITRSLFSDNSAKKSGDPIDGSGGALAFAQRATIRIENSTFNSNQAFGSKFNANGGALYVVNNSTPIQIVNSTFANNSAGWVGGAISSSNPGDTVTNTVFSNNTASGIANFQQHCSNELIDGGNNLQFPGRQTDGNYFNDVTCFKGKSAPEQKNLPDFRDPKLLALADNGGPTKTMAIGSGSPALDGGKTIAAVITDQRGTARPQGAAYDIGAFELVQKLEISPSLVAKNAATFTLTVRGANFTAASKISIGGTERTTTFVDGSTLTTQLSGADLTIGSLDVTVSGSTLAAAKLVVVANVLSVFVPMARTAK